MFWLLQLIHQWLQFILPKKVIVHNQTNVQQPLDKYTIPSNLISISPSGYFGFYTLGICAYIHEHYDTSNYLFTGTSSGAWNCFFMMLKNKKELSNMIRIIINNDNYKTKNSCQILHILKKVLLNHYTTNDFDLQRLFIGVTTIQQTNIYTDFESIQDALDCCISSSNVPFITGSIFHRYRNAFSYDGIFSSSPYLSKSSILHIHPNIWGQNEKLTFQLFKKDCFNLQQLYEKGYQDTCRYGKEPLDKLFLKT
jgi:hypothetical protein